MAVQYWVGEFFVDLSRNQITKKEHSQTIAPKALAVLTYLAENQGKVVSYDELFSQVWPDTVVSPNTLQRSIAQLRKLLDEDNQLESFIKTHTKQGYSLECKIQWHDEIEEQSAPDSIVARVIDSNVTHDLQESEAIKNNAIPETNTAVKPQFSRLFLKLFSLVVGIIIVGVISIITLTPKHTSTLTFDKLRSVTATDDKEYAAVYSPDGQYIVFHRYLDKLCMNNLWAKNITTQQEILLTKKLGTYGGHSFSQDGKKLAFVSTQDCDKPISPNPCYNLVTLDFQKALKSPQLSSLMVECKSSQLRDPIWMDNENIAVLQKLSNSWKLISYSITENKSTVLFEVKDGSLIAFDYSDNKALIAVTSVRDNGQHYIEMLKPDGEILSSHPIDYPPGFSKFRSVRPSFDPLNKQLVFSSGRQLFTLSYDGKINRILLPLDYKIEDPNFHPEGRRLLLIKKRYDSDIGLFPLNQIAHNQPLQNESLLTQLDGNKSYAIIERSTLGEENAIFQPNGESIAFISERSGEDQIWVTKDSHSQQISSFPSNTLIRGIDWATDGKSVLVNANGMLTQVFLDGQQTNISFKPLIYRLFQWDSQNNTALLVARTKGVSNLIELNLDNLDYKIVTNKKVIWAQKTEEGRLIYTDFINRFWQPGPVEDQLIEKLVGQGSSKRFSIKDNVIYGINQNNRLWSYDLDKEGFETIRELDENVDYLTDINQTHSLVELRISAKKEVVELSLSD